MMQSLLENAWRKFRVTRSAEVSGRRPVMLLSICAAAVAMLVVPGSANSARLVGKITKSAPTGIYSIEQGSWHVGDRVAVRPTDLYGNLATKPGTSGLCCF